MKMNSKRFLVYNLTDQVLACPELLTLAEARSFIRGFPSRYGQQGCYLTASHERVGPEAVDLDIVDVGADPRTGPNPEFDAARWGW